MTVTITYNYTTYTGEIISQTKQGDCYITCDRKRSYRPGGWAIMLRLKNGQVVRVVVGDLKDIKELEG